MSAPRSLIQAALAAEREQWTGPSSPRSCDELAVCQDKQPPCGRCMPAEGNASVQRILAAFRVGSIKDRKEEQ